MYHSSISASFVPNRVSSCLSECVALDGVIGGLLAIVVLLIEVQLLGVVLLPVEGLLPKDVATAVVLDDKFGNLGVVEVRMVNEVRTIVDFGNVVAVCVIFR